MTFRIGIISDTHGLLRPEAERRLAGVDHIIHGGDIGRPEIIDALRRIAPVTAIRGNVDIDDWAIAYPETDVVRLAGSGRPRPVYRDKRKQSRQVHGIWLGSPCPRLEGRR